MLRCRTVLCAGLLLAASLALAYGEDAPAGETPRAKRLLLLGQGPDGHPFASHEYMAGMRVLARILSRADGLRVIVVKADEPWKEGPDLIDGADGVLLYLAEGAKWTQQDPARLAALGRLLERGGGLSVLHWGMGAKDAKYIDAFRDLTGGLHGGPDRKYKVFTARVEPAENGHPILRGIEPFEAHDEFYYALKFVEPAEGLTPLVRVPVDGEPQTVAWAWRRPAGGRTFGFSGAHFHRNWELPEYRRLVAQGILWTLDRPIPEEGLAVDVSEEDLKLEPRGETR